MGEHRHVMYASKSAVEQVYSELFGDHDRVEVENGSRVGGSVGAKLGSLFSLIDTRVDGEINKNEIHRINFDEDMRKAKRLANEVLSDEQVPRLSQLPQEEVDTNQIFRFSCEVSTKPFESEIDGENYIEVSGRTGNVEFRGDTSTENWGSRSHIIQSVRAAKRGDTYPYQGLAWPQTKTGESESTVAYDVKFLLICGPKQELMDRWYDRSQV